MAFVAAGTWGSAQRYTLPAADVDPLPLQSSCERDAAADVDRGTALLVLLARDDARRAFERAANADPDCALAYWGQAVSWLPAAGEGVTGRTLAAGAAAAVRGAAVRARTPVERGLVDATVALFAPRVPVPIGARLEAYEAQLAALARARPDLDALIILQARAALLRTTMPGDTARRRVTALIGDSFRERALPAGAGVALLEATDGSASPAVVGRAAEAVVGVRLPLAHHLALRGLVASGEWTRAVRSGEAALSYAGTLTAPGLFYGPHAGFAPEWLMEAYLQLGRRADARALSGRLTTGLASPPADDAALLAFQLGATRAITRTAVDDRSKVLVTGSPVSGASLRDPWPHRFGLGFVAAWHAWPGGDPGLLHTARQSLETLGSGGPADGGDPEIELARALLEATMAASQDEHPTVALLMDHAADREAELRRTGRVALPLVPARELEAELWLRFYRYGDAEREARAALERSPNRWRPWLTIARAAAALGRDADARAAFERVAAIRARADADDPAIREARQALQPRIGTGGAIREDGTLAWRAGIGGGVPVRRAAPRTKGGPS